MRLLLLAPQPFFVTRGSPIAVDLMLRVLSGRGDRIDVLTYHEGENRHYENVDIHRITPWPRISGVGPGLSWKKILCDVYLSAKCLRFLVGKRYDLVIAVEEASFIAFGLCWLRGIPFICDVDSAMTEQIISRSPGPEWLKRKAFEVPLRLLESLPIRFSEGVIAVCDEVAAKLARYRPKRVLTLTDISLLDPEIYPQELPGDCDDVQRDPVVMYIGNLEPYQGVGLLIDSFARVAKQSDQRVRLVIVGGAPHHIAAFRQRAERLGIATLVDFAGPQPLEELPYYTSQADVLVSSRTQGLNTPMKLYTYLDSGVAVLATDLPTHTQVIDSSVAMLAAPEPVEFGTALLTLLEQPALRARLATRAREFVRARHSFAQFERQLCTFFAELEASINAR